MFIDTHAHLHFPQYTIPLEKILENAKQNGVEQIINVASDLEGAHKSIELAQKYPFIYATVGIHPHDAARTLSVVEGLPALIESAKVVAIGEVGLDYFKSKTDPEIQKQAFRQQLELAVRYQKPVIVHNREADTDTLEILDHYKIPKVVFHCYSSDLSMAQKILDRGWFLSFTGNITFPKNEQGRVVAKYVPLDRVMLETDCPFLAPVPHRGQINEPGYLHYIAETVARLKGLTLEEIAEKTTENAKTFFSIPNSKQSG